MNIYNVTTNNNYEYNEIDKCCATCEYFDPDKRDSWCIARRADKLFFQICEEWKERRAK